MMLDGQTISIAILKAHGLQGPSQASLEGTMSQHSRFRIGKCKTSQGLMHRGKLTVNNEIVLAPGILYPDQHLLYASEHLCMYDLLFAPYLGSILQSRLSFRCILLIPDIQSFVTELP